MADIKPYIFRLLFSIMIIILFLNILYSQSVGIGTTTPHHSAILELKDTNKGFLMPRMTTVQRDAIVNPPEGLQLYNLNDGCVDVRQDASWSKNCLHKKSTYNLPPNHWTQKANFGGTPRSGAVGFSIGAKGYIGTGSDGTYKNDFWEYDPSTNIWTQKANFGGAPRSGAVGFSIGAKGYIGTGYDNNVNYIYSQDFWQYDPVTNMWTQKAAFPGEGRINAVGFSVEGIAGFIGTGYVNNSNYKKDFWLYNPTSDSWLQRADFLGDARYNAVGFSRGNKGYIGTGLNGNNIPKKDFYEYDPYSDIWTIKSDLPGSARYGAIGFSMNENGFIGPGFNGSSYFNDCWIYTTTGTWIQVEDYPSVNIPDIGFSIGSKGFVYQGKEFWQYNWEGIPSGGRQYEEIIGIDGTKHKGIDWTTEGINIYPSLEAARVKIKKKNTLEFGYELSKETNAGKIGYNTFSINALDIVGAGINYPNRNVKIFDRLYFENSLDNRKLVLWETANNNHQFYGLGVESGTLRYQIAGTGNVHRFYAGTSASSSKLLYTIFDSGDVEATRDAYALVNMFAMAFIPSSDIILKSEIVRSKNSLQNLMKLNSYNYKWKDQTKNAKLQTGLIAQEVQKVYPHLVVQNKDGILGVNYNALVPELIEAVKELKYENEALKKTLQQTQNTNVDLNLKHQTEFSTVMNRLEKLEVILQSYTKKE